MLKRVAMLGGGLSRALRCVQDYTMTRAPRGGAWTRRQLYRIARRHGIRITPGRFVPGQPAFDTWCPRCTQSLRDTPWCSCLPQWSREVQEAKARKSVAEQDNLPA